MTAPDSGLRFTWRLTSTQAHWLLRVPEKLSPYHKIASYTMACKALPSTNLPFTMRSWTIAERSSRLTIVEPGTRTPGKRASLDPELEDAIREYLRTYVVWRGIRQAMATFGVSRHTLWRFLRRGHTGRVLPRAVLDSVGDSVEVLEAATWAIPAVDRVLAGRPAAKPVRAPHPLSQALEDTLLLLCATPLATVDELSRFGRVPASTLRDRLKKLAKMGMADSVSHSLGVLGPHPHLRYFPTEKGIDAGAMVEWGTKTFLREYPVSKQWFRLLADRLDAVAALYRVAALVADADSLGQPVREDHYRQGPYDMLITLSGGRSVGLLRQGPTLTSANLRYRLRTLENLPHGQRPMATLVLAHSDQANRRAVRTLGDVTHHRATFVATEGGLLAGNYRGVVWQQCGNGTEIDLPVEVAPGVSLNAIMAWTDRAAGSSADSSRQRNPGAERKPRPDPETLYPGHLRAAMPEPSELLRSSLAVRLTRAEKDTLDLLAAWPLCTTDQMAGLMGGVTRRAGPTRSSTPWPGILWCVQTGSVTCSPTRGWDTWPAGTGPPWGQWWAAGVPGSDDAATPTPRSTPAPPCAPSPPRWSITTPSLASPPP